MRLTRIDGSELRSDPARLLDAVKATGFFPGPRAVFRRSRRPDGLAPVFEGRARRLATGDAQIIATAGRLDREKSALRKLFEGHKSARAAAIYDEPPGRADDRDASDRGGPARHSPRCHGRPRGRWPAACSRAISARRSRNSASTSAAIPRRSLPPIIAAVAPLTIEAELDDILHATAESEQGAIGPILSRLFGAGGDASSPSASPRSAISARSTPRPATPTAPRRGCRRSAPPVFGPRRDRMLRLGAALGHAAAGNRAQPASSTPTDLGSAQSAPQMALMERTLIRLAMMPGRTGALMGYTVDRQTSSSQARCACSGRWRNWASTTTTSTRRRNPTRVTRISPRLGKVPLLVAEWRADHRFSVAIHDLPRRPARSPLTFPAGTIERARQDSLTQMILDEIDAVLWTAGATVFIPSRRPARGPRDQRGQPQVGIRPQARPRLVARMAEDGPFLMGETMTIADILLAHCGGWAIAAKFPISEPPPARAYRHDA